MENEFNTINNDGLIDNNINNSINNEINNNPATDSINDDLSNIVMSYVNDDSNIVEPTSAPVEEVNLNSSFDAIQPAVEEANLNSSFDVIQPVVEEPKSLFEVENDNNFQPIIEEPKPLFEVESDNNIETPSAMVEDNNDDEYAYNLISLGKADNYENSIENNNVIPSFENMESSIEVPTIQPISENNDGFTFNSEGYVVPMEDSSVINNVEENKLTAEQEAALNEIKEDLPILLKDLDTIENTIDQEREMGMDKSVYLADTFEKFKVYNEINKRVASSTEEYLKSVA